MELEICRASSHHSTKSPVVPQLLLAARISKEQNTDQATISLGEKLNQTQRGRVEVVHLGDEEEDEHARAELPFPRRRGRRRPGMHRAAADAGSIEMLPLRRGHQGEAICCLSRRRTFRVHDSLSPVAAFAGRRFLVTALLHPELGSSLYGGEQWTREAKSTHVSTRAAHAAKEKNKMLLYSNDLFRFLGFLEVGFISS